MQSRDGKQPFRAFLLLTIALGALYFSTAPKVSWSNDPFTNTVSAWALAAKGTFFLDDYSAFLLPAAPPGVASIIEGTEGPMSMAPPGAALHAAPLYLLFDKPIRSVTTLDEDQLPFTYPVPPIWPGALVAALTTAGTCGVLYLIFRRLGDQPSALVGAAIFARGTGAWSVSSQALWRHGPTMMWIALGILLSGQPRFHTGMWWIPAILTRPQSGVIPLVLFSYRTLTAKSLGWLRPLVTSTVGLLLLLAYNRYAFGAWSLLGGFTPGQSTRELDLDIVGWIENVVLGLVHPGRGLLPISPFLLILIPGIPLAWQAATSWIRGSALGGVAYLLAQFYLQDSTGATASSAIATHWKLWWRWRPCCSSPTNAG